MDIALGYIAMSNWKEGDKLYSDWMENLDFIKSFAKYAKSEDEIILPGNTNYVLVIDYPLKNPYIKEFKTSKNGMSRKEFVKLVVDSYNDIYDTEERSSKIKAKNIDGMMNRITTVGTYGIWRHSLDDLILHTLHLKDDNVIELGVDS